MARTTLIALPLLLSACSDTGVKAYNTEPVAEITSHGDGSEVLEGYVESFRGVVSDVDDGTANLTVSWYMDGELLCEGAAPDVEGVSLCEGLITASTSEIALEVQDPDLAAASDHVSLTVIPTESPEVEIVSPDGAIIYYSDQLITFEGIVTDAEDIPADLQVVWESSLEGEIEVEATPNDDGELAGATYLGEGEHFVTLTATDLSGKTGSDNVTVDVGPPNSAPSCEITAPESGASGEQGETVIFEATVGDVDVPADWLSVTWKSDKDGDLGESSPDTSGSVAFLTSDLSSDSHVITLDVTDEIGATCSDYIIYSVGTPPSITIDDPASGEVFSEDEVVSFQGSVSDGEDPASSLGLSWVSDLDGEFSTQGSDSAGSLYLNQSGLSLGSHTITVTVTDTDELYTQAMLSILINSVPTAPEVELSPDPASTTDDLIATLSTDSTDADGDPISYTYTWYVDGTLSSASTATAVASAYTSRDETWTVEVTPDDGYVDGPSASDSLTIDNTEPEISDVSIDPDPATVSDVLLCSWTFDDDDSDSDASSIEWTVNGTSSGTSTTLSGVFVTGDSVTCSVTASDGTDTGNTDSDTISIINTPPVLDSVTLSPDPAYEEDTLSCTPGTTTDDDGTTGFDYAYAWEVAGVDIGESGTTIDGDSFERGDEVICIITPNDGDDDGDPVESNAVTISNHPPEVISVSIGPDPAYTDDTITATVETSDEEGDTVSLVYSWYVDSSVSSGTSNTLDGSTDFDRDQEVYVVVTPFDGTDVGSAVSSDSIIVSNTPPNAPEISLAEVNEECLSIGFDGVDDLVELGSLDLDSEWTFETWLKWDTRQTSTLFWNECFAIGSHYTWSEFYLLHDYECDGDMDFYVDTSIDSTALGDSDWHHLVVTFNGQFEVFVDGTSVGTAVPGYDSHRKGPYTGGLGAQDGHWYADAKVNSLRISDTVRYTAAFSPEMFLAADDDTHLFWLFDEEGVSTIEDLTGNGYDGTVHDARWEFDCPLGAAVDGLLCTIDSYGTDADGDSVSHVFSWDVDGTSNSGAMSIYESGDAMPSTEYGTELETWTCTVTPNDGTDDGTPDSESYDIDNGE